ncbi:hypothetical protein Q9S71_12790 [Microbacterium sp. KSW4-11]|uniref:DUF3618 domain-containing protein n=1 Tax=Microbacterium gawkjiense TaxID=3067309 RepID=A0ABU3GD09_9MICO|nr:hypothetical protein [Microbacterium sp. KSW4-11]MDT3317697.1 hypothetical protein [Microbacterium sp. KSW4-11]
MTLSNEGELARALDVPDLRNLSDEKKLEIAAMMDDIAEPLRSQLYDLIPGLRDAALEAVTAFERIYGLELDANDKNQKRLHDSLESTRSAIRDRLQREELSAEQEATLLAALARVDELAARKDTENKAFIADQARETRRGVALVQIGVPIATAIVVLGAQALLKSGNLRLPR